MVAITVIQGYRAIDMACPFFLVADFMKVSTTPIINKTIRVIIRTLTILIFEVVVRDNSVEDIKEPAKDKVFKIANVNICWSAILNKSSNLWLPLRPSFFQATTDSRVIVDNADLMKVDSRKRFPKKNSSNPDNDLSSIMGFSDNPGRGAYSFGVVWYVFGNN